MCGRTIGGKSCWANTNASSRKSETRVPDWISRPEHPEHLEYLPRRLRRLWFVIRPLTLASRANVVPLDHLVQCGRLDVEELGRALLNASRGLERRLDQPLLKVRNHVLERNSLWRDDEL